MPSTPEWVRAFVAARMDSAAARSRIDAEEVARIGGIRLYGTIGGEGILRPDGSVWFYEVKRVTPEEYGWRRATYLEGLGAIVLGIEHFPELRRLLPERPSGEPDCRACHGTGEVIARLQCPTCMGLGWVPKEAA